MRMNRPSLFLALLVLAIVASRADASKTYSYEFIEGKGYYKIYGAPGGGGALTGSFSVEVDGSQISVNRFDIRIEPFLDIASTSASVSKSLLSDILGVDFLTSKGIVLMTHDLPPRGFVGPNV